VIGDVLDALVPGFAGVKCCLIWHEHRHKLLQLITEFNLLPFESYWRFSLWSMLRQLDYMFVDIVIQVIPRRYIPQPGSLYSMPFALTQVLMSR
jgi:hypothetical protein